ncbi:MAG: signal peptidase II [Candidatus Dasytiphilus stammeri]
MSTQLLSTGLRWLWITVIIIIIDFISKQLVMNYLVLGEIHPKLTFLHLNFYYVHNIGAAFNLLADQSGWQRWFFIIISVIAVFCFITMMYKTKRINKIINIALALILGGTLSNLLDRFTYGFVIDFIDVYIQNWHLPTFNIADLAIFIGIILIIFERIFISHSKYSR